MSAVDVGGPETRVVFQVTLDISRRGVDQHPCPQQVLKKKCCRVLLQVTVGQESLQVTMPDNTYARQWISWRRCTRKGLVQPVIVLRAATVAQMSDTLVPGLFFYSDSPHMPSMLFLVLIQLWSCHKFLQEQIPMKVLA